MDTTSESSPNKIPPFFLNYLTNLHKSNPGKDLLFKFIDGQLFCDLALMAAMSPFMQQLFEQISGGEIDSVTNVIIQGSVEAGKKLIELLYTGKTQIIGSLLDELTMMTKILGIRTMSVDIQVANETNELEGYEKESGTETIDDFQLNKYSVKCNEDNLLEKKKYSIQELLKINDVKLKVDKKENIKSFKREETKLTENTLKKLSKRAVLRKDGKISWANNRRGKTDGIIKPCYICPNSYIQYFDFTSHLKEHSSDKGPYACPQCQELCENGLKLHAHIQKLHVSHQNFTLSEDRTKFICKFSVCKKEFSDLDNCVEHIETEHSHKKKQIYLCRLDPCKAEHVFTTLPSFRRHTLDVHKLKPLACPEEVNGCIFRASDWQKLDDHLQGVHKEKHSRNLPCDVCGKKFTNQTYLMSHRRRMHEVDSHDRGKICPYCGESKLQLLDHISRAHKDFRFSCDYCPKKFKTSVQKRLHHNTHTGFRPYTCGSCELTFARLHHRKTHLIKTGHEPGPVLKPEGHIDGRMVPRNLHANGNTNRQQIINSLNKTKIGNAIESGSCGQIIKRLDSNQGAGSQIEESQSFINQTFHKNPHKTYSSTVSEESCGAFKEVDIFVESTNLNSEIDVNTF